MEKIDLNQELSIFIDYEDRPIFCEHCQERLKIKEPFIAFDYRAWSGKYHLSCYLTRNENLITMFKGDVRYANKKRNMSNLVKKWISENRDRLFLFEL